MQIKRLYVKNFRNIREQEFCFHENVNVLCGNNAQGRLISVRLFLFVWTVIPYLKAKLLYSFFFG